MNKKPQSSNHLPLIVLLLTIVGLCWWAYIKLDYRIEEVNKGYKGEALTNPLLAAEYFLRTMGQESSEIQLTPQKVNQLDPDDTLLILGERTGFDKRRSGQLLAWVKKGGHLIITGQASNQQDIFTHDHILDLLALDIQWRADEDGTADSDTPVNVDVIDDDGFWQLDFVDYQYIFLLPEFNQEVVWSIEQDQKTYAIQIAMGDGLLTVLSDMRIFRSAYISRFDHAAFLYSLAGGQFPDRADNVFYYSLFDDHMSLFGWLYVNARLFLLSLVLLLLFTLWSIVPRFGPLINVTISSRKKFLDHLSASGNYHWRQGNYSVLLSAARNNLLHDIKLNHPEWLHLSRQQQLDLLSSISDIKDESIDDALFKSDIERLDHFTRKIKILEKLRKCL